MLTQNNGDKFSMLMTDLPLSTFLNVLVWSDIFML